MDTARRFLFRRENLGWQLLERNIACFNFALPFCPFMDESALTGAFRRDTPRYRPTCFGCGAVGHVRRNCPRDPPRKQLTCYECGNVGHIRRYCPEKFKIGTKQK